MSDNEEDGKEKEKEIKEIKMEEEEESEEKKEKENHIKGNQIKEEKQINILNDDEEDDDEIDDESKEKKDSLKDNNIKNMELDSPYHFDASKKVYKISSTPLISEITILNTKNNPPNRCYITAEFSEKNNSIICIGGTDEKCEQYDKITEYNISKNVWEFWKCEDQSESGLELSGHSSNLITLYKEGKNKEEKIKEEKIFIFGGYDNWKNEFTAQSCLIDINMKTFEKINYNINLNENNEFPMPRTYHSSNYDQKNNVIYIYGGTDMNINHCKGDNFQALWKFNLMDKIWNKINLDKKLTDGPPRGHVSILFKHKLYIIGGVTLFKKFTNNMYIIDLKENTIKKLDYDDDNFKKGCIPEPLAFHSGILLDDKRFLIHGGLNKNYNAINTCYIYYIKEMKFDKISIPLIPNLFGHKILKNNSKNILYIVGGMNDFQYVGDKNLIYQNKEDKDKVFNQNEQKIKFFPMENILEISFDNSDSQGESYGVETGNKVEENKNSNKRIRWKKLFYVNINENGKN